MTEWVLGILGAIAAFVGGFILLGPDDQYVGIGGDLSWAVGEIDPAWGWGLLIGGVMSVVAGILLAVRDRRHREAGMQPAPSGWADLLAHSVIFVVANAFMWLQDVVIGGGLNYAYWATIGWAIGLGAHAYATYTEQRHQLPAGR